MGIITISFPISINNRLNNVEFFVNNFFISEDIIHYLKKIGDLERLISKVSLGKVNPRELIMLRRGLDAIKSIKDILLNCDSESLKVYGNQLALCEDLNNRLSAEIDEEALWQYQKVM
ncbi:MAG: hypothetical protein R2771_13675 [Saprospiraceae bacterium]